MGGASSFFPPLISVDVTHAQARKNASSVIEQESTPQTRARATYNHK